MHNETNWTKKLFSVISSDSFTYVENMGQVTNRNSLTSRAITALSPWNHEPYIYTVAQLMVGSNPISKLEVVSSLNSLNLGRFQYHYNQGAVTLKYNPKVYMGTVQSVALNWNEDQQKGQTNGLESLPGGGQKSGSWP